jgi:hypothetical protein
MSVAPHLSKNLPYDPKARHRAHRHGRHVPERDRGAS